jgi:steroid 5-alpha reductase family enzyme
MVILSFFRQGIFKRISIFLMILVWGFRLGVYFFRKLPRGEGREGNRKIKKSAKADFFNAVAFYAVQQKL